MKTNNYYWLFFALVAGVFSLAYFDGDQITAVFTSQTTWLVAIIAFFLFLAFSAVSSASNAIKHYVAKKEGRDIGAEDLATETWWEKTWQKLQDSKPIEEETDIALDHNYDGIVELDNNLPPWWLWGFYLSMVFAVVYLVHFHVLQTGDLQIEEYEKTMAEAELQKAEYLKTAANLVDENTVTLLTDEASIKAGKKLFALNCAVCHAADGGGGVGPNLVDDYWIHGGSVNDVFKTIKYGVPEKGMISWKDQMNPSKMQQMTAYILSLKGTVPVKPKEPQGELYQGNAAASPNDSAQ